MDPHANFSYSTVATPPSPATTGTTIQVATGEGANFPPAQAANPASAFNAVVWPIGQVPKASNAEIVRVTDRSGDTLTVVRTQEGSSARTIGAGDQIAANITSKILQDIELKTNPPGTIIEHAGFVPPPGTIAADGAAVSRTTYPALLDYITDKQSGTLTSGANSVTGLTDTSRWAVGMPIEGTGIPAGTTILAISSGTAITISQNATASGSQTLRVFAHGNGNGSTTFNVPDRRGRQGVGRGTHADNSRLGATDALPVNSRTQKHGHSSSLSLPDHGHTNSLTLPNHGHAIGDPGHGLSRESTGNQGGPYNGWQQLSGLSGTFGANLQDQGGFLNFTGVSVGGVTSAPAINGAVGGVTSAPAINGAVGVGGGVNDTGAFIVMNYFVVT